MKNSPEPQKFCDHFIKFFQEGGNFYALPPDSPARAQLRTLEYYGAHPDEAVRQQRAALRETLIDNELRPVKASASDTPTLLIMQGLPGSGKSTITQKMKEYLFTNPENVVELDPIHFCHVLPEYELLKNNDNKLIGLIAETWFMTNKAVRKAVTQKKDIVVEFTDPDTRLSDHIRFAKDHGYKVAMVSMMGDVEISAQRTSERQQRIGHLQHGMQIPRPFLERSLPVYKKNFIENWPLVDSAYLVDNRGAPNSAKLVASSERKDEESALIVFNDNDNGFNRYFEGYSITYRTPSAIQKMTQEALEACINEGDAPKTARAQSPQGAGHVAL